jgi:hypothetical protein
MQAVRGIGISLLSETNSLVLGKWASQLNGFVDAAAGQ